MTPKASDTPSKKLPTFAKVLPYILIIAGVIGIICSSVLIYDQVQLWRNPNYQPACSLNPIVSCGSVINSNQGHIFHIPAPFLGLVSFTALVTVGVSLLAGAKFKRWFWLGVELVALGGVGIAIWLFILSLYRIHALCPFCLATDVVTYVTFWYLTLYNLRANNFALPARFQRLANFMARHHLDILILWFLVIFAIILQHFWYYYGPGIRHIF